MSDAFTKSAPTPDDDIDAWLSGVHLYEKRVTIYARPDLAAEYDRLDEELRRLNESDEQADDDRLASKPRSSVIADRMDEIRSEMAGSAKTFRFRAVSGNDLDRVKEEAGAKADNNEVGYRLLAVQCVEPKGWTWQHFATLNQKMGEGYFSNTILKTANEARESKDVSLPFSLAASVARSTQES